MTSIALRGHPKCCPPPASRHNYLAQDVNVVIVILVLFLLLIVEDHFFFSVVNSGLEDPVRPLVLLAPFVLLALVLEVVVADVWIPIRNADIHTFVLQDPGNFSQHLLAVLLGIGPALSLPQGTKMESSMPLSITQSKVSF